MADGMKFEQIQEHLMNAKHIFPLDFVPFFCHYHVCYILFNQMQRKLNYK